MALTKRQFADKLRTMNRSGSKAPMQGVKLPTNQSNYRTPSMSTSSTAQPQATGPNAQQLATAGGLLGKVGKQWYDDYKAKSVLGGLADADQGINLDPLPENVDVLGGLADAGFGVNLEEVAPMNLSEFQLPGVGAVGTGEFSLPMPGALGTGEFSLPMTAEVGDVASTTSNLPGIGTTFSIGSDIYNGNYGRAAAKGVGAGVGSLVPGGTGVGAQIGGLLYDFGDKWF